MSNEYRFDAGASYPGGMSALICAQPSQTVWNGTAWVAESTLTIAQAYTAVGGGNGAAIVAGVKALLNGAVWDGDTYWFSQPGVAPPAGTTKCTAKIFGSVTPVQGAAIGTVDYLIAMPSNLVLILGDAVPVSARDVGGTTYSYIGASVELWGAIALYPNLIQIDGDSGLPLVSATDADIEDAAGDAATANPAGTAAIAAAELPTAAEIDTELSTTHGSGAWGAGSGSGITPYEFQVLLTNGQPLYNCAVTVFLDEAMTMQVPGTGTLFTNQSGIVTFNLDSGNYWFNQVLANVTFSPNPIEKTVP